MQFQKKALYNLILLNLNKFEKGEWDLNQLEPWQVENYRRESTERLFARLHRIGIRLEITDFENYAHLFETPEEMACQLTAERTPLESDQIYLLVFELWRRYFPEKRALSIFCDELDYQIMLYDLEKISSDAELQNLLYYLLSLLHEHSDEGQAPRTVFDTIQTFCANDLESFLYDYIFALVMQGQSDYALELIEGFYPYIDRTMWFDFLSACRHISEQPEEGCELLQTVMQKALRRPDLDLCEEILQFLAEKGGSHLFPFFAKKVLPLIEEEDYFQEFLSLCLLFFEQKGMESEQCRISTLLTLREHRDLAGPVDGDDADRKALEALLSF